jgi:hypothetical protein
MTLFIPRLCVTIVAALLIRGEIGNLKVGLVAPPEVFSD